MEEQLALVDCGGGRRLDRLGGFLLDRPSPAAESMALANSKAWDAADARFDRELKTWSGPRVPGGPWIVEVGPLRLELRAATTDQVGIFLEQLPMWQWLGERVRRAGRPLEVLNLFAHTGGSTLAAAAEGARVVHVDAQKSAVVRARRNAELSGLAPEAVRWVVEDVGLFARREEKRGRGYDGVVLDPPSYGHGPNREPWKIDEHLPELLATIARLTKGRREFVLLTTHTPGYDGARLGRELATALGSGDPETGSLDITAQSGNRLPAGAFARWCAR